MIIFNKRNTSIPSQTLHILFFTLLALSLFTCQNEEEPATRPYPRIRTLQVKETPEGTVFTGEIFYSEPSGITDHGFIWTTTYNNITEQYKKSLGPKNGPGTFSATITNTLRKDLTYTVKSYATNGKYMVYGTNAIFDSRGSLAPQFLAISPEAAGIGDTVTIRGNYFNYTLNQNKVWFDEIEASVIEVSDTTIKVIIPVLTFSTVSTVKLLTGDQQVSREDVFRLAPPVINRISASSGGMGDVITIWGDNFHPIANANQVVLSDAVIRIKEAYVDHLVVEILSFLRNTKSSIKPRVTIMGQVAESSNEYELLPTTITDIQPRTVKFGDTIIITGTRLKGFDHDYTSQLKIGYSPVDPVEITPTQIKAVVPNYFETTPIDVSMIYFYQLVVPSPVTLDLFPHQVNSFYPISGKAGDLITIEGENFSPCASCNVVDFEGYEAQVREASATKLVVEIPMYVIGPTKLTVTLAGRKVYAGDFTGI
ncbi:hypothetical protein GXP67_02925 [Rhodocytophaga rosea]|uniref:IPT/TIG domain-containing protein n=1 Tax=Rhodocytophaga rosea TaxID=2704465 RepID=A0A6C0GCJ5_9BACT|nr:IPT/TIG domain-containing protein [Rhodocytophaga rosea]QHT65691.1 hypothetical protein GXP67_02925 [Rhodocytophaga rosea]